MVFSSHVFFFYFLPVVLAAYYAAPRRWKHLTLTLFSYFFYGWANPYFVVLMFASTLIDFLCGLALVGRLGRRPARAAEGPIEYLPRGVPRTRAQKTALALSLCTNLALLGFFKYFNFGVENYNALAASLGLERYQWETFFRLTLPLGISFYTFQSMSYAINVYRGEAKAVTNFTDFSCFVSMFPHLVAGPINRFQDLADQLEERSHTAEKFARGAAFVSLGMAKKILLANPCGKIADTCFDAGALRPLDAWWGLMGYSFQIYFDFSAYSDMAVGFALMMGFVFAKNFDSPYRSESITDFWRRWHLSLSTWLRENVYIPLGGNRGSASRTYVNLMAVMLIGGLWHGASWNFVIWGTIHGGMLCLERVFGKRGFFVRLPRPLRVGGTFLVASLAWVFFRSADLPSAMRYMSSLAGFGAAADGIDLPSGLIYQPYYVICLLGAASITWTAPQTWNFTRRLTWGKAAWCFLMLEISLVVMMTQSFNPFIYFIF